MLARFSAAAMLIAAMPSAATKAPKQAPHEIISVDSLRQFASLIIGTRPAHGARLLSRRGSKRIYDAYAFTARAYFLIDFTIDAWLSRRVDTPPPIRCAYFLWHHSS